MELRWRVNRNIYDYFTHIDDPVLEILDGNHWVKLPIVYIEHDKRKFKDDLSTPQSYSEKSDGVSAEEPIPLPPMPKYPNTTRPLESTVGQMDLF